MANLRPLRVCIDAREPNSGGVRQTLIGLAHGLSRLGGEDEFLFLVRRGMHEWLNPHLGGRCGLLPLRGAEAQGWRHWVRRRIPAPLLERIATNPLRALLPVRAATSDGTVERAGVDVLHLARQGGFVTRIPTVYCPHDLQHVHLPAMFGAYERRWRAATYGALAARAVATVALTRAGKRDLVTHLGVPPERVYVIGWAPAVDAHEQPDEDVLRRIRQRYSLPDGFALFPAQTLPHKNHLALLEALAILRAQGLVVPLVCSGTDERGRSRLLRRARALRIHDQVHLLGYLPSADLAGLYALARLMVFPSLFEGFGMPVLEAFRAGVPVACSDLAALAELAGEAAVRFDPRAPPAIAAQIRRTWSDSALRAELAERGRVRAAGETWEVVARKYRALYRMAAGRQPSRADAALLEAIR